MKGIILSAILITSTSFAETMNCTRLADYITGNQHEIFKARGPGSSCTGDENTITYHQCQTVGSIEEKIARVENEITLLMGFQQMKDEIRQNRVETADPNITRARKAAADFKKALSSARALERILNTTSTTPLIQALKALPLEQRNNSAKMTSSIANICRNLGGLQGSETGACVNFRIENEDEETVANINTLIENEITPARIDEWKAALQIQTAEGQQAYSFSEMYNSINGALEKIRSGNLSVSRRELQAINSLPEFSDANPLQFLNALKGKTSQMKVHAAVDGFRNLTDELKNRQTTQTMSKVSWLVKQAGTGHLTPAEQQSCREMLTDVSKTKSCWEAMKAKRSELTGARGQAAGLITNMEAMIDGSFNYLESVSTAAANCLTTNNLDLADGGFQFNIQECSRFNGSTEDLNAKVNFANELKALKASILESQSTKVKLTVAAIDKYKAICGNSSGFASLDLGVECPTGAPISPSAEGLISDLLGMAVIKSESSNDDEIEELCESATRLDETFCSTYYTVSEPTVPNVPAGTPTPTSPYIEAPNQRDPSREAFIDGLSGIGWGIVNQLTQRPQMYNPYQNFNPYPYNSNPYFTQPSQADQVLFNARFYGGYGYYSPTLGAAPYTAFPMVSPYVQAAYSSTGNSSPYFTSFGTYK